MAYVYLSLISQMDFYTMEMILDIKIDKITFQTGVYILY